MGQTGRMGACVGRGIPNNGTKCVGSAKKRKARKRNQQQHDMKNEVVE
jgi:hypothetical protein